MMDRGAESLVNKSLVNISSDELHNQNCFDYIKHLALPENQEFLEALSPTTQELFKKILALKDKKYNDVHQPFGDLLSQFLRGLQNDQQRIKNYREGLLQTIKCLKGRNPVNYDQILLEEAKLEKYHRFLHSIYNNPNQSLIKTYDRIKQYPETQTPVLASSTQHRIQKSLRDPWRTHNQNTPAKEETMVRRTWNVTAPTFMPQIDGTNLPYQIQYPYIQGQMSQELHIGTQAQRIGYETCVAPLFQLWVDSFSTLSQAQTNSGDTSSRRAPITHVYIDKLKCGQPRSKNPLSRTERLAENKLSYSLRELENMSANIAVLTLPADEGLMRQGAYLALKPTYTYQEVLDKCIEATVIDGFNDFYLSRRTQQYLFGKTSEKELAKASTDKYNELLEKSFKALGFNKASWLSEADQQAVWFHFINFELTDFILQEFQPKTFNISCKDAIDRGAVASAYLNLMRSFATNTPLTREEFDRALQTPAAMVKARGMNHHLNRIWNVIDKYVDANLSQLEADPKRAWLIEWRDVNCPPKLANYLLDKHMNEYRKKPIVANPLETLENSLENDEKKFISGSQSKIFAYIKLMHSTGIGDPKLLLTIFAMTKTLSTHPDDNACKRYQELAHQLPSLTSRHRYIAGLMVNFGGFILGLLRFKNRAGKLYRMGEKLKEDALLAQELKKTLLSEHSFYANGRKKANVKGEEALPLIVRHDGHKS